jgi:pilus assembly protein CpaB
MSRRSPRTVLLWTLTIVVAVVTAITVISSVSSLRRLDTAYGRIHPLVVARRDLAVGTRLTAADLTTRRLRGEAPAPDALTRPSTAVGRIVRSTLLRGDVVTARHLTRPGRPTLGGVVPAGHRAVRLVIEHGLRPTVGDLVDVFATFDPATLGDGGDPTVLVAPAVPVLAVDAPVAGGDTVGITVIVTPTEASRLAFSASTGTLGIAVAPPEAATTRTGAG